MLQKLRPMTSNRLKKRNQHPYCQFARSVDVVRKLTAQFVIRKTFFCSNGARLPVFGI